MIPLFALGLSTRLPWGGHAGYSSRGGGPMGSPANRVLERQRVRMDRASLAAQAVAHSAGSSEEVGTTRAHLAAAQNSRSNSSIRRSSEVARWVAAAGLPDAPCSTLQILGERAPEGQGPALRRMDPGWLLTHSRASDHHGARPKKWICGTQRVSSGREKPWLKEEGLELVQVIPWTGIRTHFPSGEKPRSWWSLAG